MIDPFHRGVKSFVNLNSVICFIRFHLLISVTANQAANHQQDKKTEPRFQNEIIAPFQPSDKNGPARGVAHKQTAMTGNTPRHQQNWVGVTQAR